MTKIKLCGLSRSCDIAAANELRPEFIGFVFAPNSKRFINPSKASELKRMLASDIKAVGVFVNENAENIAELLNCGTIDIAQLHGNEDEKYISNLRKLTDKPIIKAFRMANACKTVNVEKSAADYVLLDSGAGTGTVFDWNILHNVSAPYFLAGGLDAENVGMAVRLLKPFAVDVSSGIETDGIKDKAKMAAFVAAVRKEYIYDKL